MIPSHIPYPVSRIPCYDPTAKVACSHQLFVQEDEIILIVVGGVLGALAGLVQMRFGWGGPEGVRNIARATARAAKVR